MTEVERLQRMGAILVAIRDDARSLFYPTGLPSLRLVTAINELVGPGDGPLEPLAAAAGSHREQVLRRELDHAQAEVVRFREREAYFAKALNVTDSGQYRADWPGAIERVLRDREAKDEALTKAADTFRDFHAALTLLRHDLSAQAAAIAEEATRKAIGLNRLDPRPIPMILHCPKCSTQHVDEGIWATTRLHKSHLCASTSCNHKWRVADVPTVGVATLSDTRDRCCDRYAEPNIMDALDGPICHCGKPSALESGVCADCGNWDLAR